MRNKITNEIYEMFWKRQRLLFACSGYRYNNDTGCVHSILDKDKPINRNTVNKNGTTGRNTKIKGGKNGFERNS